MFLWLFPVGHITSEQDTKESMETNLDPLSVVQLRNGRGLAQTGSTNVKNSARVHMLFWKEKRLADGLKAVSEQT